jgi:spoIIIJ-associated protein
MPIADKVAAAHSLNDLLKGLIAAGAFKLKYRITVDPKLDGTFEDPPEILVEFAGPDSGYMLDRGAELLRSFETIAYESLRLGPDEHTRISFDCRGYRAARMQELRTAASVAAERVRKTGMPYQFGPMSSRERRIIHLALREHDDLKTESAGEGPGRSVVVYPKNYDTSKVPAPALFARRRR